MKPHIIIIHGPAGTGKTTVATLLHKKMPKSALLSVDAIKQFIAYESGNASHLKLALEMTITMARTYLKNGYVVIIERALSRDDLLLLLTLKKQAPVLIYQLEALVPTALKRVEQRKKNSPYTSPPRARVKKSHATYHSGIYPKARIFDSEHMTSNMIAREILKELT